MGERAAPLAAVGAFSVVAALFLLPYVANELAYPLGWDSPFYVWRTAAVGVDGLDRIGGIRPATPLLFHGLGALTGTGPFTIAAAGSAVLAAVAGLSAAGLLRAAFGIGPGWVPVVALVTWLGFGHPGMVREQPDNVLNAALVLGAYAAAVHLVRTGRGWWAVSLMLSGAGLAHWPFFVLALGTTTIAASAFAGRRLIDRDEEDGRRARKLLGAAVVAAGAVGAAAVWRPAAAWTAPRLGRLSDVLLDRFRRRVGDAHRLPILPLAGLGIAAASRRRDLPGRRLFLHLMLAWIGLTALGVALQAAGVPTAGLRLLNHLFPLTLLTAALLCWLGANAGRAAGAVASVVVLLGFGALAIPFQLQGKVWYEPQAVQQAASAGAWLLAHPGTEAVVTIPGRDPLTTERRRNTVRAAMPPRAVPHVGFRSASMAEGPDALGRTVIALRAYDAAGYEAFIDSAAVEVAEGVSVLAPGAASGPPPPVAIPASDTRPSTLAWIVAAATLALFGAGLGWSRALLPGDPLLIWTLAPAIACALTSVIGVAWAAVGLPLDGAAGAGPLALTAMTGAAAGLRRVRTG